MVTFVEVSSVIGAITGIASLGMYGYLAGVWKGSVDTKVNTMWQVYVLDALNKRPDLASHSSAYKLTQLAVDLIPDLIKKELGKVTKVDTTPKDIACGITVVKKVGMHSIESMSQSTGLSVAESLAILSYYLKDHINHCSG